MDDYYLFRGCLIPTRLPYLERSSIFVLDSMGVKHEALPQETCCVEPIGLRSLASDTWLLSAARILAMAESGGKGILTLCNGCAMSLREAQLLLRDQRTREETNRELERIGMSYRGRAKVLRLTDVLEDKKKEIGPLVTSPLDRLKVVSHPGCHLLRPSEIAQFDRPFQPQVLSQIIEETGAEVAHSEDWPRCCGGTLGGTNDSLSASILDSTVRSFRESRANAIVTPCPFCFFQFDVKQRLGLPVLFISELLALAFGAEPDKIGVQYHRTKMVNL